MNLFKVEFIDNGAVSARLMHMSPLASVQLETIAGKRTLKWLTIYADTEQESIRMADAVVRDFFQFLKCA